VENSNVLSIVLNRCFGVDLYKHSGRCFRVIYTLFLHSTVDERVAWETAARDLSNAATNPANGGPRTLNLRNELCVRVVRGAGGTGGKSGGSTSASASGTAMTTSEVRTSESRSEKVRHTSKSSSRATATGTATNATATNATGTSALATGATSSNQNIVNEHAKDPNRYCFLESQARLRVDWIAHTENRIVAMIMCIICRAKVSTNIFGILFFCDSRLCFEAEGGSRRVADDLIKTLLA